MGSLAQGSELTVMRASGVSIGRIGVSVGSPGYCCYLCAVLIGEFLAPPLAQMARANKAIERNRASTSRAAAVPGYVTAS